MANLVSSSLGIGTVGGTGAATRVAYWSAADTLTSNSGFTFSGTQLSVPSGSAAAPAVCVGADMDTGLYLIGANQLGIATAGTLRLTLSPTLITSTLPVVLPVGATGTPSLYFVGDVDTGIYSSGEGVVDVTTAGTTRLSVSATLITSTLPLVLPVGATGTPSLYFAGDVDTGIYSSGEGVVDVTTAGTTRLTVSASLITSTLPLVLPVGATGTPSLYFVGDVDTGIYSSGEGVVDITTAGTTRLTVSASLVTSTLPVVLPAGAANAPALRVGEADTGLYSIGDNQLGITTGNTLRVTISTSAVTSTLPIITPAGAAAAPALGVGETDSGLYSKGDNQPAMAVGGAEVFTWGAAQHTSIEPIHAPTIGCRLTNSGAFSCPNDSWTPVTFDTEWYDSDAYHSTVSNTSRITIPVGRGGKYYVWACLEFAGNASGDRGIELLRTDPGTGSYIHARTRTAGLVANVTANDVQLFCSAVIVMADDGADYVEVLAYQNSGGALNIQATGSYSPTFGAVFLGT